MKNIFRIFVKKSIDTKTSQEIILEFVNDTENIKKAAEGSMTKRLELIKEAQGQPA
ncbi:MAG: hypothetical protein JWN26_668 [Candidatus Saccharibacteria bacterium]|jgi:hypothetical protein|nr:hypothetical protein [Candidatus Saccharibacteria bacterium]